MKHIKKIKDYLNPKLREINKICKELSIDDYSINDDYSITINGDFTYYISLTGNSIEFPVNVRECIGNFDISCHQITSFKNCPKVCHGDFIIENNQFSNFIDCPNIIEGCFSFSDNNIKSLKGLPKASSYEYDDNPVNDLIDIFGFNKLREYEDVYNFIRLSENSYSNALIVKYRLIEALEDYIELDNDIGITLSKWVLKKLIDEDFSNGDWRLPAMLGDDRSSYYLFRNYKFI